MRLKQGVESNVCHLKLIGGKKEAHVSKNNDNIDFKENYIPLALSASNSFLDVIPKIFAS